MSEMDAVGVRESFIPKLQAFVAEHRVALGIVLAFVVTRIVMVAVGMVAMAVLPQWDCTECLHMPAHPALDMWYRWDAAIYASKALYNFDWILYHAPTPDMAFFPLYPLILRAGNVLVGCVGMNCQTNWLLPCSPQTCTVITGLILSTALLLASAWMLYDLTVRRFGHTVGMGAVWLLMLCPNAIFLSGIYTEPMFLFLALSVFWLLDRERFGWAVAAAGLACLTRTVGLALMLPLLWAAWTRFTGWGRWLRMGLALIPGMVMTAYIFGMGLYVHQPLAYFTVNGDFWGRSISKLPGELNEYLHGRVWLWGVGPTWTNLGFTVLYLALALVALKDNRAMGLFALVVVLISIASGSLLSMPRYGAVAFPVYIYLMRWADRPYKQALVYGASAVIAVLFVMRFVTWHFVA